MNAPVNDEAAQLAAFEALQAQEKSATAATDSPPSDSAQELPTESPDTPSANNPESRTGNDSAATSEPVLAKINGKDVNIDVILDVKVNLSMEAGRTRVPIRHLMQLNQGSVVELDRAAGEPLDVYVNGTLIAHGEVVVVNDKFGIRLTDVVSPADRIRNLR